MLEGSHLIFLDLSFLIKNISMLFLIGSELALDYLDFVKAWFKNFFAVSARTIKLDIKETDVLKEIMDI